MPKFWKQSIGKLLRTIVAFFATLFFLPLVYADVGLNLKHNVDRNTYVNGQEVIVKFEHATTAANDLSYHWQNYKGEKLTVPMRMNVGDETVIRAPAGESSHYLGLVFTPVNKAISLAGREPGEAKEYGFAIFPDAPPKVQAHDPNYWMGMVHADLQDPWLRGWVKTLTWQTTSAKWWRSKTEERRAVGSIELPIISGSEWKSDDYKPIEPDQLDRLSRRVKDYFAADPTTIYWETGIEENLGGRFKRPFYLENLAAKSNIVRAAADEVNPNIQLIFQIANMRYKDVGVFMKSAAAKNYDILSLHPYNWPSFPPPEKWLKDYLDEARDQMKQNGRDLPIWVTEIGAPHRGNCPDCFFGYPKDKKAVPGLTNQEMIAYMVKFHVIAVHQGVEKVFWYNYKDRGSSREFAEDHFGLIDFWGYPKPAYLAYINLNQSLVDKAISGVVRQNDIWAYKFNGDVEDVVVAWSIPAPLIEVALTDLGISASADSVVNLTNAIGDPLAIENNRVVLTREPVFIHIIKSPSE